jgi:hypothetical protein
MFTFMFHLFVIYVVVVVVIWSTYILVICYHPFEVVVLCFIALFPHDDVLYFFLQWALGFLKSVIELCRDT